MNAKKWNNNACAISLSVTVLLLIAVPSLIIFTHEKNAEPPHTAYPLAWIVAMAFLLLCDLRQRHQRTRFGVLIDSHNVISLSRIQMLIWIAFRLMVHRRCTHQRARWNWKRPDRGH
ncbi:hypothetical protein [Burkholderia pseudomallei]|uniref:hypothetical protein n=1 Tax=Burkholderia pseudomallei TaxID=28450 RepID=UPI0005377372|nr:hypothetical protein [Burkholderia pseudomallei]KGV20148.1 hypothetical protein X891_4801 [Burkholderia pseudomallei TSV 43]KGV32242.1 hypothetical protein X893_3468 [Burkholderia pseudomallei TSV 31]